jgi:alpha-1,3-mannosyltransferase
MDVSSRVRSSLQAVTGHKYFFAINLYNSFDVIPDLFATLFRVAAILGYQNVFVSIYENGSTDQTKALLRIFDALTRSVGMRVTIRTSMRTRGAFNHRIEYLAEVRNAAFVPLHELRDSESEYFDTIVFMNDILPCVDDLLELIWQSRRNNAGITCAADYMYHNEIVSLTSFSYRSLIMFCAGFSGILR